MECSYVMCALSPTTNLFSHLDFTSVNFHSLQQKCMYIKCKYCKLLFIANTLLCILIYTHYDSLIGSCLSLSDCVGCYDN